MAILSTLDSTRLLLMKPSGPYQIGSFKHKKLKIQSWLISSF